MTRWYVVSIGLTAVALAAALYFGLERLDVFLEQVPVHWDAHMQPDQWVARDDFWAYLLIFPGVMAIVVLLMWGLPYLSPKNFEVDRFGGTWCYIMTLMVGFFGYLFALQVWTAMGATAWFDRLFVAGFFVMFGLMGNVMGKVQRNFWMGVRTPWTLASEAVWVRTHRVAAWTWTVAGLLGAVLVLAGVPYPLALALLIVAALWPGLYSLFLYKRLQREGRV
jgi:uncharacterized membrane protein